MTMEAQEAFPLEQEVSVRGGKGTIRVKTWTMAQRRTLKPRLGALFEKLRELQATENAAIDFKDLFDKGEDELVGIVRATIEVSDEEWDALLWEDLPSLVQAIWETSVQRLSSGGLAGKAMGVVSAVLTGATRLSSPTTTSPEPRPEDSPSSHADGAPPPSS